MKHVQKTAMMRTADTASRASETSSCEGEREGGRGRRTAPAEDAPAEVEGAGLEHDCVRRERASAGRATASSREGRAGRTLAVVAPDHAGDDREQVRRVCRAGRTSVSVVPRTLSARHERDEDAPMPMAASAKMALTAIVDAKTRRPMSAARRRVSRAARAQLQGERRGAPEMKRTSQTALIGIWLGARREKKPRSGMPRSREKAWNERALACVAVATTCRGTPIISILSCAASRRR